MAYTKGDTKKIIVGAAAFFISAADSATSVDEADFALPTLTGAGRAEALVANDAKYKNVGFTSEGVEVSYEPDFGDVAVDQLLDSARIFKQGMKVTVKTTLAEATLENLLVVWGQRGTSLASDVLTIEAGELGDEPIERSLVFVGPAPRLASAPAQRIYHVTRAIQTESSSHALRRSEATTLPVSFRILPGNGVGNAYGTVRDRAIS